jgi:hypothetical protein
MTAGVTVDFNANLARFTTGVEKAINDLNKFENQGKRVSAGLKDAFATLGVGLSVAGLGAFIKGSIDAQDHLNDLRLTTNLTIKELSGLKFAAQVSGSDLDSLAASVTKLAQNMGKDAEKFKALGITAKDPLEAFKQLADVFVKVQDPQLRAALGAEALGKSWQGAAPLMMEGSKGIGELIEKGSRLSGITEESAKAADTFNEKMTELVGTGVLTNKMVSGLLPLLNTLADDLIENRDAISDLNIEFNPLLETGKAIAVLFGNVAFVFKGVGREIGGVAAQINFLRQGEFSKAFSIGDQMKADAEAARKAFDEWEKKIMGITGANPGAARAGKPARDAKLEAAVAGVVGGKDGKDGAGGKGKKSPRSFDPEGDLQFALDEAARKRLRQGFDERDAEEAKAAADQVQRLNALLAATPSGQLEKAREEMQFLAAALETGAINEAQFTEAVGVHYGKASEALDQMSEFAVEAARGIQDAFADFLFDPFDDKTDSMLDKFSTMLRKMAAQAAAAQLNEVLFGEMGKTGKLGGLAGMLAASFTSGGLSAEGKAGLEAFGYPGYAQGTPWVPNDGLAYLHKGEQVIPAGKSGGSMSVTIVNNSRAQITQKESTGNGQRELVVMIEDVVSGMMGGGKLDASMRQNFGASRVGVLRG